MKKWILFGVLISFTLAPAGVIAAESAPAIAYDEEARGVVTVTTPSSSKGTYKIRISKEDEHYTYDAGAYNVFPLQLGDGNYTVMLLQHVKGNTYKLVKMQQIAYTAQVPNEVYLQSIQNIHWDETMDVALKAAALTKDAASNKEKIEAIHRFVVSNMAYDDEKAGNVASGYIPSVEQTYESMTGICYDYAALIAAMLRSVDIPTKLVMGHRSDISEYHAWNEVYLEETGEWMTLDATYNAAWQGENAKAPLFHDAAAYTIEKIY